MYDKASPQKDRENDVNYYAAYAAACVYFMNQ